MLEVIRRTWLPTLLFCMSVFALEFLFHAPPSPPVGTYTALPLIVVPPVWWRAAGSRRRIGVARGAAAGAVCGAAMIVLPVSVLATLVVRDIVVQGMDQAGIPLMVMILTFAIGFGGVVIIGAGIGVITALLQGWSASMPPRLKEASGKPEGEIEGAAGSS